ncbi:nitroreductase family deazaflavin-dependent oxidoreductase [Mycobacterium deserti]|uniref:Nitroreductase family deazaflavin-dependent oxidoreductase n=1 Tax=Mycobacterium deserti TaxID=2978347 RepID=A0ABT2M7T3_9MYCO|nr:nitroreductase family deazaflavin-dependent oxidoreductase [Mycobacterium deserti]MCT7658326.1 nitroreductase family deazaflavin-dependent oxidoreductase [Mycobacterium deserti]
MADDKLAGERNLNDQIIDEFRRNEGKVGGQFEGFPLLLLHSTGAKSGEKRINPIAYFEIDDRIYVVGSAAGRDASPSWVFNLRAYPQASIEIGADPPKTVTAHELPPDERDRIYEIVVQRAPGFGEYQQKTDRVIPVFELALT